jgi:hypothetical protein
MTACPASWIAISANRLSNVGPAGFAHQRPS